MNGDGGKRVFPPEEFAERIERLRVAMRARGVDAVIADECEMLHYFTGFVISLNFYRGVLIPLEGDPIMLVRLLDEPPFLAAAWFDRRRTFDDTEDPIDVLGDMIGAEGLDRGRIALDMNSYCMPARRFAALRERVPDAEFVDFHDVLLPMRLQKSAREIEVLRRACAIADAAMRQAIASAGPGTSTRAACAVASGAFVTLGADTGRSGPVTRGQGWNFLHSRMDDRPMEPGDILHLELVPKVSGYCAKLMRPAVMGEASAEQKRNAETLIEIQDRQLAAMVPGADAREVDAIVRDGVVAAGLRDDYRNNTGYTLGFYFEQAPRSSDFTRFFTPAVDFRLEPGMVFHMHCSAAGMAFSETMLVTDEGPQRLTQIERKLFETSGPVQ